MYILHEYRLCICTDNTPNLSPIVCIYTITHCMYILHEYRTWISIVYMYWQHSYHYVTSSYTYVTSSYTYEYRLCICTDNTPNLSPTRREGKQLEVALATGARRIHHELNSVVNECANPAPGEVAHSSQVLCVHTRARTRTHTHTHTHTHTPVDWYA